MTQAAARAVLVKASRVLTGRALRSKTHSPVCGAEEPELRSYSSELPRARLCFSTGPFTTVCLAGRPFVHMTPIFICMDERCLLIRHV